MTLETAELSPAARGLSCAEECGNRPRGCPGWCMRAAPLGANESPAPQGNRFLPIVGERVARRWRVRAQLGSGAMGVVFLADDVVKGGTAAVKVLRPDLTEQEAAQSFAHEGRALARVRHAGVIRLLGRGVHRGSPFVVMEHVPGTTLATLLRTPSGWSPSPARIVALVDALARAIDATHAAGILHGDIKPSNILLGPGRVVLGDFGLARPLGPGCLTAPGEVRGTPLYLAPEIASGISMTPSRASDIYALATVTYELLLGTAPFPGDSAHSVLARQLHDVPPPPSLVRPHLGRLDKVFAGALSKRRHERPTTGQAFARSIARELGVAELAGADLSRTRQHPRTLERR